MKSIWCLGLTVVFAGVACGESREATVVGHIQAGGQKYEVVDVVAYAHRLTDQRPRPARLFVRFYTQPRSERLKAIERRRGCWDHADLPAHFDVWFELPDGTEELPAEGITQGGVSTYFFTEPQLGYRSPEITLLARQIRGRTVAGSILSGHFIGESERLHSLEPMALDVKFRVRLVDKYVPGHPAIKTLNESHPEWTRQTHDLLRNFAKALEDGDKERLMLCFDTAWPTDRRAVERLYEISRLAHQSKPVLQAAKDKFGEAKTAQAISVLSFYFFSWNDLPEILVKQTDEGLDLTEFNGAYTLGRYWLLRKGDRWVLDAPQFTGYLRLLPHDLASIRNVVADMERATAAATDSQTFQSRMAKHLEAMVKEGTRDHRAAFSSSPKATERE